MMRFISILLVIAGLLAAGIGGAALMDSHLPKAEAPAMAPAPPPPPMPSPVEEAEAPPAPERVGEPEVATESAPLSDDDFNFQPMVEAAPAPGAEEEAPAARAMRSAPPMGEEHTPEAVDIDAPNVTTAVSESFIDSLKTVPVAHETPRSAEYKRAFDVTFAIDATGDDTAADALPGRGMIEEGTARVSDRVEVRLSGAAFTIVPTSPPIQALSPLTENTWRWSVTALSAGDHDLTFEIFAIDSGEVVPLRTYRDTVTVNVSGLNRAIAFADQANPLFVLLGGLGSLLAGLFGIARFFSKK
ncbi:MAG: hypothetical protein CVT79_10350 [Alphaproteobacteria bacterium HGW-Alphaproteobacteria-18]|nr:MAG: hypothetical protein CVT79_10350 [Alphaproteobacteria bacterium HGW-Alphaproteobacteria-18]